jgi:hypothetical protein
MNTNDMQNITAALTAIATRDEARALHDWYGPNWAALVSEDETKAAVDGQPHPLNAPTFGEFADAKSAAAKAWYAIRDRMVYWTGEELSMNEFADYIAEARSAYDAPTLALADHLGEDPANITEERGLECGMTIYSVGSREYIVGTDDEANEAWDQALDAQLDECGGLLDSIPEHLVPYFDRTAWKRDARHDGRGHTLALYDGHELELAGDLYAFRIN